MSICIADVNQTYDFAGNHVDCCFDTKTPNQFYVCAQGYTGSNIINTSMRYKTLCAWGFVLIAITMLTIMVAKKQAHEIKNRGKASKCIIFVLFLEYLAWWCFTIAATAISGDNAGLACWDRGNNAFSRQWSSMRWVMWEMWGVMLIFTLAICGVCLKARRKEPLMANQNAAMQQPQPQVTVIQTQPAYGQQPAYGYGAPQQQYGY